MVIALAASMVSLTGCASTRRECRDATGKVLPSSACTSGVAGARWVTVRNASSGGFGTTGGSFGA